MLSRLLADLVNGDDVGMLQPGGRGGFGAEADDVAGSCQRTGTDKFDRDDAVEAALAGFEDDSHATVPYFLKQLVITQLSYRQRRGRAVGEHQMDAAGRFPSLVFLGRQRR